MYNQRQNNNYQRSNSQNPYSNPQNNRIQRNQTYNGNNQMDNFFNDFINKPFFGIDDFSDPFDDVFSGFGFGRNHIQNLLGDMKLIICKII